jgi:hypothetical protein
MKSSIVIETLSTICRRPAVVHPSSAFELCHKKIRFFVATDNFSYDPVALRSRRGASGRKRETCPNFFHLDLIVQPHSYWLKKIPAAPLHLRYLIFECLADSARLILFACQRIFLSFGRQTSTKIETATKINQIF